MLNNNLRILLLEGIHKNAVELLNKAGFNDVELQAGALEDQALIDALAKVDVVGIRSRTQLNDQVLRKAAHLKAIGCFCIGTNQVALDTAQQLGIPVFNAPYSNTRSVAELVIAQIIFLLRGIVDKNNDVHRGTWPKTATGAHEARGKVLGIIGYGNIGTQLSVLAESLGMKVIYHDILAKLPMGNAEPANGIDDLLARANIVSLHVPQDESTKNMIGARELALMKKGSFLINAARGHCLVIEDVAKALQNEHLAGAAIDVFPTEPKNIQEALDTPLRGMKNVILTPHIGGSTVEAQANIGMEVADKLARFVDKGTTVTAVNFPEISLPKQDDTHRILHIHRNRPGILSAVNKLFAQANINIIAQSLMTKGDMGYLVTDVAVSDSRVALEQLRTVDETIRARLLY